MRLLMISGDRSILSGKKGAFWYTLEELSKHFERIDVICPRNLKSGIKNREGLFGNVYFHPSLFGLWYQPFWVKKMGLKLIGDFGHEVMTIHDYPPFYNGIGARWILRYRRIRSVLEIHHIVGWPRSASISERLGFWLSRLVLPSHCRHFAAVRTVSRSVADKLAHIGVPKEKIRIVPSFYLDSQKLKPDPSIEKKYDLVFCGRLVKNKGLSILLDALKSLPTKKLLVIGDGPERHFLEQQAESRDLTSRVTFLGWLLDQAAVIRELQSARIFVLPSLSEGGPRIALEAMAVGMPVIATKVGVLPEIIQDGMNGIFTDGTSTDLRKKIDALLSDDIKRLEVSSQAARIIEKFERTKLIKEYADFLKGN